MSAGIRRNNATAWWPIPFTPYELTREWRKITIEFYRRFDWTNSSLCIQLYMDFGPFQRIPRLHSLNQPCPRDQQWLSEKKLMNATHPHIDQCCLTFDVVKYCRRQLVHDPMTFRLQSKYWAGVDYKEINDQIGWYIFFLHIFVQIQRSQRHVHLVETLHHLPVISNSSIHVRKDFFRIGHIATFDEHVQCWCQEEFICVTWFW